MVTMNAVTVLAKMVLWPRDGAAALSSTYILLYRNRRSQTTLTRIRMVRYPSSLKSSAQKSRFKCSPVPSTPLSSSSTPISAKASPLSLGTVGTETKSHSGQAEITSSKTSLVVCNNTVVVLHSTGLVLVNDWYDNVNTTAIVWAGTPRQESDSYLVDALYGHYNPSGKLPFTFRKSREDYVGNVLYEPNNDHRAPQQNLTSLNIDYCHFDAKDEEPIYEFGFGTQLYYL